MPRFHRYCLMLRHFLPPPGLLGYTMKKKKLSFDGRMHSSKLIENFTQCCPHLRTQECVNAFMCLFFVFWVKKLFGGGGLAAYILGRFFLKLK